MRVVQLIVIWPEAEKIKGQHSSTVYTLLHFRAAAAKKCDVAAPHFLLHVSGCKFNGPLHNISSDVLAVRGPNREYAFSHVKQLNK